MRSALSFPQYLPSLAQIRSHYLFYDKVSTIVPRDDQQGVLEREAAAEIGKYGGGAELDFIDPEGKYTQWLDQQTSIDRLKKYIEDYSSDQQLRDVIRNAHRGDNSSYSYCADHTIQKTLFSLGWRHIAYQKFPQDLWDQLHDAKLALRVVGTHYESQPTLVPPKIADFVMTRLSRQIASDQNLSPVDSKPEALRDLLQDDMVDVVEKRSSVIAFTIRTLVPRAIEDISITDFVEIRDAYSGIRVQLAKIVDDFLRESALDTETDALQFRTRLSDRLSDFEREADVAYRTVRGRKNRTLAIDVFSSSVGAGLGACLGGIPGAMIGAGLSPVIARKSLKISTQSEYHSDFSKQIGAMRTRVLKERQKLEYEKSRPMYYL